MIYGVDLANEKKKNPFSLRIMRSDVRQIRTIISIELLRKTSPVGLACACFVAPLLHIMHVCLLARDFRSFSSQRIIIAQGNWRAACCRITHRDTALVLELSLKTHSSDFLAESYENQSNSDFACHYARLRSRISDFASQMRHNQIMVDAMRSCNCQRKNLTSN